MTLFTKFKCFDVKSQNSGKSFNICTFKHILALAGEATVDDLEEVTDSADAEVWDDDASGDTRRKRKEITEEGAEGFEEHGGHVHGEALLSDDCCLWGAVKHVLRNPVHRPGICDRHPDMNKDRN